MYEELFAKLEPKEPPQGLYEKVLVAIAREHLARRMRRFWTISSLLLAASLGTISLSWMLLAEEIGRSGFHYLLYTAVSDLAAFLSHWREFCLAILESLPITGLAAFTASIGAALLLTHLLMRRKDVMLTQMRTVPLW